MYERILVPLDGSKVCEYALPYVEDLMSKLSTDVKVEIALIQVLSPVRPVCTAGEVGLDTTLIEKEIEEARKKAIGYLNKTGEALRSKGATVTAKVEVGDASKEIVKAAKETNADLIAMSTHGRSGFSRWAFGSVADKVLRHGENIPILMVRAFNKA